MYKSFSVLVEFVFTFFSKFSNKLKNSTKNESLQIQPKIMDKENITLISIKVMETHYLGSLRPRNVTY